MKTLQRLLFILIPWMLLSSCTSHSTYPSVDEMVKEASLTVKMITPQDLNTLMTGGGDEVYTLIDVRQEIEHYYGFIPGSVVIPRGSLEFNISDSTFCDHIVLYMTQKEEKIIVYCKKGQRGILAAQTLGELGFTNVSALEGGWKNWELTYPDLYEKELDKLGGGTTHATSGGC